MTLSIARLDAEGYVDVALGYSAAADILDNPEGYPATFVHDLQRAWAAHPWANEYRIITCPDDAAAMVKDGLLDAVPSGWTFGYPHGYVGDGYLLCPACVAKQVADGENGVSPDQMACELFVYQEAPQAGDTCDQCSQYIPGAEPHCGQCGDGDKPLLYSDTGDQVICRECLAALLVKTRTGKLHLWETPAHLAGVNTFTVGNDTYRGEK